MLITTASDPFVPKNAQQTSELQLPVNKSSSICSQGFPAYFIQHFLQQILEPMGCICLIAFLHLQVFHPWTLLFTCFFQENKSTLFLTACVHQWKFPRQNKNHIKSSLPVFHTASALFSLLIPFFTDKKSRQRFTSKPALKFYV